MVYQLQNLWMQNIRNVRKRRLCRQGKTCREMEQEGRAKMSLYIPGISVSCCLDCPCASYSPTGEYDGFWKCDAKRKIIKGSLYEKQEWCPLIEVPPHGRLIDADDMERHMCDTVQGDIRGYQYADATWGTAFDWIDSRPTIIPADGADKEEP